MSLSWASSFDYHGWHGLVVADKSLFQITAGSESGSLLQALYPLLQKASIACSVDNWIFYDWDEKGF